MAESSTIKKEVSQAELAELNSMLDNMGGTGNVITPTEKKTVFSKPSNESELILDDTFGSEKTKQHSAEDTAAAEKVLKEVENVLNPSNEDGDDKRSDSEKNTAGRPKVDKNLAVEVIKELIDKKFLSPFDEDKKVEEYSKKDIVELLEANFEENGKKFQEDLKTQFFSSLSPTLQHLAKYEYDGGDNIKDVLQAMLSVEETHELDVENEKDQESIVRSWLQFTNLGTAEEIEEEITSMKDRAGELENKAKKWKPKLDEKHKERLAKKVAEQEVIKKQYEEAAAHYENSVLEALKPGDLNGIKLDQKTQSLLYNGLTSPQYPSRSGRPTNLFGHLLEKYQFVEPDPKRIMEALWLLADRDGFIEKVKAQGAAIKTEEVQRKLKQEQSNKNNGAVSTSDDNSDERRPSNKTVKRKPNNFFART